MIGKITVLPMRRSVRGWLGLAAVSAAAAADPAEFLEARVRPGLANKCYSCHANSAFQRTLPPVSNNSWVKSPADRLILGVSLHS